MIDTKKGFVAIVVCLYLTIGRFGATIHAVRVKSLYLIYTIILLMDLSFSLFRSVALILGLYRPSSGPIALRNVLKCSIRHTLFTIRFWHFSAAAFIAKNTKNVVCASNPVVLPLAQRSVYCDAYFGLDRSFFYRAITLISNESDQQGPVQVQIEIMIWL